MDVVAWNLAWWHWLVIGIVLLLMELLTPGALFLIFFGAAAVVVGLLSAIGLAGPLWLQIVLFAALSIFALLAFRRVLVRKLHFGDPARRIDQLIGETAVALDFIAVETLGKVELRGAAWNARNIGPGALPPGARCTVVTVEGLTLWVTQE